MDEQRAEAIQVLSRLDLGDFITELVRRLEQNDHEAKEVNGRAVELEFALTMLLRHKKPTDDDYKFVELKLRDLQGQLRIPGLYEMACVKADVAGSILVKS